ncbi:hypothetical protein [Nannocystis bainbridge]|uniref:Uncharacterized protein n=1 Tax=Nannocystis bainbridge TaxID=2995303 RepID=A0ABT5E9J7_9BACT|nr:hypothetical protein [Nannocystis bainbridge]MDC0722019.1 hypothetical protein [Nannocystis bainbridge]
MPRLRPQIGLAIALVCLPQPAHADSFRPPEDKLPVEVTIAVENLDAHPEYIFVLWPDACLRNDGNMGTYTVLNWQEDDGRPDLFEEGCSRQRLFAYPRDTYSEDEGVLSENARQQLGDDPPSDPRVLVQTITAEEIWWVPDEVDVSGIEDVYRVGIDSTGLSLTPTRVRFRFSGGAIFERLFYKGRRPRLPRVSDTPPKPPPAPAAPAAEPAPAAADTPAPDASATPDTKAEPPTPDAKAEPPAPVITPAPPASEPEPATSEEISQRPWLPPPLMYGGACLLVAIAAGLALRRRPGA